MAALHWAAAEGNVTLVRWLLHNGAHESIYTKNKMGCTPLDLARIFGPHPEVVVVLILLSCLFLTYNPAHTAGGRRARGCFARS